MRAHRSFVPPCRVAVLVVKQHDFGEVLEMALTEADFRVLALDALPAVDDVARLDPNVIIVDTDAASEQECMQYLDTIRHRSSKWPVSVVLSSSSPASPLGVEPLARFADVVLLKPFGLVEFEMAISAIHDVYGDASLARLIAGFNATVNCKAL